MSLSRAAWWHGNVLPHSCVQVKMHSLGCEPTAQSNLFLSRFTAACLHTDGTVWERQEPMDPCSRRSGPTHATCTCAHQPAAAVHYDDSIGREEAPQASACRAGKDRLSQVESGMPHN